MNRVISPVSRLWWMYPIAKKEYVWFCWRNLLLSYIMFISLVDGERIFIRSRGYFLLLFIMALKLLEGGRGFFFVD